MAGLVEKDFRLIWCNKQALIFLLIIGVVIGLQNEAVTVCNQYSSDKYSYL